MESTDFDWLDDNWPSNHEPVASNSFIVGTSAEPASQAAERVDQPSSEFALPLL